MRENDFKAYQDPKCFEPTNYVEHTNHGDLKRYSNPKCAYYDIKNNKCSLNGCIKNLK